MPNAKVLSEKQAVVEALTGKLRGVAGVLVDYSGITVAEDTEMRAKLRSENVDYAVVKNTLMRFAIRNVGLDALDPLLNGTTSLAVSTQDAVAPARIIKEYAAKLGERFNIKGGFMDGRALSADEVNALASIPPLPILRAQVLGTMLAPIVSFAIVIKAIAEKGGLPAESVSEETAVPEAEAAPAPVEEAPIEEAAQAPAEAAPAEEAEPEAPGAEAPAAE